MESSAAVTILTFSFAEAIDGPSDLRSELVHGFFWADGPIAVFGASVDFLVIDIVGDKGFCRVSGGGWTMEGLFGCLLLWAIVG